MLYAIIIITFMLQSVCAIAAPSAPTVSGTVTHGSSITLSGTGFGTKSPAKPQLWAPFDTDINPSSLGVITSWATVENYSFDTDEGINGSGVAKGGACDSGDYSTCSWTLFANVGAQGWYYNTYGQHSYVFRKTKRDWQIGSYNTKNMRADTSSESSGLCDVMQLGSANAWGPEGCEVDIGGVSNSIYMQSTPTAFNNSTAWTTEEILVQANTSTSEINGYYGWRVNGSDLFTCDSRTEPCDSSGPRGVYLRGNSCNANIDLIPGAFVTRHENYPNGGRTWADDIYIDNTWSRVMICTGSTWASRGSCEIQIPSAWSTTSATVTVNQGSFADGATAYVYVVDSTGAVNSSGTAITFGSGAVAQASVSSGVKITGGVVR